MNMFAKETNLELQEEIHCVVVSSEPSNSVHIAVYRKTIALMARRAAKASSSREVNGSPWPDERQAKNTSNGTAAQVRPLIRAGTGISPLTRNCDSSASGVLEAG